MSIESLALALIAANETEAKNETGQEKFAGVIRTNAGHDLQRFFASDPALALSVNVNEISLHLAEGSSHPEFPQSAECTPGCVQVPSVPPEVPAFAL